MKKILPKSLAALTLLLAAGVLVHYTAFAGGISAPVINFASGTYSGGILIKITDATAGTTIMYTTDGSVPTDTHGTEYTAPFGINYNTGLRAVACSGTNCSLPTNRQYQFASSHAGGGSVSSNPNDRPSVCTDENAGTDSCPPKIPENGEVFLAPVAPMAGIAADNKDISLVSYSGALNVFHADDFAHKKEIHHYQIFTADGKTIDLKFANEKDAPTEDQNGKQITVAGILNKDKTVSVSKVSFTNDTDSTSTAKYNFNSTVRPPVSSVGLPKSKGILQYKVATVLFNFSNLQNQTYPASDARHHIYDNTLTEWTSVNGFYNEAAYGKINITGAHNLNGIKGNGDVYGWETITQNDLNCSIGTAVSWVQEAAHLAMQNNNFDPNAYDVIVFIFPVPADSNCGWGGFYTQINFGTPTQPLFKKTIINTGGYQGNIVHELGHSLGLLHSNALSCVDSNNQPISFSLNCLNIEYGDPFDIMGGYGFWHFSTYQKNRLGVLPASAIVDISSMQSGQYDLYPQETLGSLGSTRVIQITEPFDGGGGSFDPTNGNFTPAANIFTLEYRRPYGVWDTFSTSDPVINGVSIRVSGYNTTGSILDMHPNTTTFSDAPLGVGESFTFPSGRVISVLSADSTKATVSTAASVSTAPCTRVSSQTLNMSNLNSNYNYFVSGNFTASYHIANLDSSNCPPSTFEVPQTILVNGYNNSTVLSTQQIVIASQTYQTFNVNYILDPSLVVGNIFGEYNDYTDLDTNTIHYGELMQWFVYQPTPLTGNLSTQ